jgi:predicted secreted Zn-dependent protease
MIGDTAIMVTPERLHARSCRDLIARTDALRAAGGRLARTLIGYRYDMTPRADDPSSYDLVVAVDTVKTTVMMPDLSWPGMTAAESAAIATLTQDILTHERGHLRIAFAAVEAFDREQHTIARSQDAEAVFSRFFRAVSDEQIAYDALTEHGIHQSRATGEFRGNDLVIRCPQSY